MPVQAREPELRELVSAAAVGARIEELAVEIAHDFEGRRPLFIVIAEGARRFAAAIAHGAAARGVESDELVVRARRSAGTSLQTLRVDLFDVALCADRDILVLDDIADEGRTLTAVLEKVRAAAPRSLRVAVLVSKHARRQVELPLDHVGFQVEDGWIVGFGMDLDGRFRELDHLAVVVTPAS
jgi:hypoxanthine phosphoribosyltransferase